MIPGQGVAMVLRQSIMGGSKAALLSSIGNCLGILMWSVASAVGLSAVFSESQTAYVVLKWSGVVFLTYISLQTFASLRREGGSFELPDNLIPTNWASLRLGLVTNLTNAKAAVYAVAFIPSFIPTGFSLGVGIILLGLIWALISITWNLLLIWSVKRSSVLIQKPVIRRALTATSATGILVIAVTLALS